MSPDSLLTSAIDLMPTQPAGETPRDERARFESESTLPQGSVLAGRYTIRSVVGRGAMGTVHAGWDLRLSRPVAIKVMRPELSTDAVLARLFEDEAQVAAALRSPHVVRVFDRGHLPSGEPFIVMEWLDGEPLDRMLASRGPLPITEAVDLILDACAGLAEAHQKGVVHRDVKPANLIVCTEPTGRKTLKVVDFGISKRILSGAALSSDTISIGSPCYMSPEQVTGSGELDARTDVWSLGVVLFESLTGRQPFEGDTIAEVLARILADPAPSLRALRSDVDRGLEAIVWRCLEKEPCRRFKNADALREALMLSSSEGSRSAFLHDSTRLDEPSRELPRSSASGVWLGMAAAVCVSAISAWSLLGGPWGAPALAPGPEQDVPRPTGFTPLVSPARGVYADRVSRDSVGRSLRAVPERQIATSATQPGRPAPERYGELLATQGTPLNEVWMRERRTYEDGRLVDVHTEIIEPPHASRGSSNSGENEDVEP